MAQVYETNHEDYLLNLENNLKESLQSLEPPQQFTTTNNEENDNFSDINNNSIYLFPLKNQKLNNVKSFHASSKNLLDQFISIEKNEKSMDLKINLNKEHISSFFHGLLSKEVTKLFNNNLKGQNEFIIKKKIGPPPLQLKSTNNLTSSSGSVWSRLWDFFSGGAVIDVIWHTGRVSFIHKFIEGLVDELLDHIPDSHPTIKGFLKGSKWIIVTIISLAGIITTICNIALAGETLPVVLLSTFISIVVGSICGNLAYSLGRDVISLGFIAIEYVEHKLIESMKWLLGCCHLTVCCHNDNNKDNEKEGYHPHFFESEICETASKVISHLRKLPEPKVAINRHRSESFDCKNHNNNSNDGFLFVGECIFCMNRQACVGVVNEREEAHFLFCRNCTLDHNTLEMVLSHACRPYYDDIHKCSLFICNLETCCAKHLCFHTGNCVHCNESRTIDAVVMNSAECEKKENDALEIKFSKDTCYECRMEESNASDYLKVFGH
ncbi:hypothetical protein ABK040_007002 [Willaertia magna]